MPNKFFKGRFALAGMLLVGLLASCGPTRSDESSTPSIEPSVDSSEPVSEQTSEESLESLTSEDPAPSSSEESVSSEATRYALILQYDQALVSVTGTDGNPLAAEYEEGTSVSFRVTILNETYGNLTVNVNGLAATPVDGVYSFEMTRKTTVRISVELITVNLTTDNSNVSLVFVGDDGAPLESQTGTFVTGSSVRFRLTSRVTGYTEFHDLTVSRGEETLVPVDGIYSLSNLADDTVLHVVATEHSIGENEACTVCEQDMKAFTFAAKDNCTVDYIEGKGWKVSAIDKNSGYEFVINPTVLSHYLSKGQTYAKILFGNGTSFGTKEADGVVGNPVNCSFNAIAYNEDLSASTKYAEGFFSGINFVGGEDDICGPAFNIESDKLDVRFYVNPNDASGQAVGTSYIYDVTAIDPLGVDAYFQTDDGEIASYVDGQGWKVTGNHFKLNGNIVSHYLNQGKKTMRVTFGPAYDDALENAETVRLIINGVDAAGETKKLADKKVNSMTPNGLGGHYYMDFDLTDANTDWTKGLEFYSWGIGGQYITYFSGIEFLDSEVSPIPEKNSYLVCDKGQTGYFTEGSGWLSSGAHFFINGSVINHFIGEGKKTMRVTFGAGQRLMINGSKSGAGVRLFDDHVSALTADESGNGYMDFDLLDTSFDWDWGIEVYSYASNVAIPNIEFLDTEIDRSPSKTSYFVVASNDVVSYEEGSGWTATLNSGNAFKVNGTVIEYYRALGKKTLRLTFSHNERYIIEVSQNGAGKQVWNDFTSAMKAAETEGQYYMDFDLLDSAIDWSSGIQFYTWGTTGSNPYTVKMSGIDFLDTEIDRSPAKETYLAVASNDVVSYEEGSGWTATLNSGNELKVNGAVIEYYRALGKKTLRLTFSHNERYIINVSQNGATKEVWNNKTSSMRPADIDGQYYMDFDLLDTTIDWSFGIQLFSWGTTGSNPYTVKMSGIDFLDTEIDLSPVKSSYFSAWNNWTVEYVKGKGWKISAIDKSSGYEFHVSRELVDYYFEKGQTVANLVVGNGTSFETKEADGVVGNPVNCSFIAQAYNDAYNDKTTAASGYFSGKNFTGTADDLCGPSMTISSDKRNILIYVNPTDAGGKACGTTYIYDLTFSVSA